MQRKILTFFNILHLICLALTLITWLAPHITPSRAYFLEFLAIGFPLFLAIHFLFLVLHGYLRQKKMLVVAAIGILFSNWYSAGVWNCHLQPSYSVAKKERLKVMTMNANGQGYRRDGRPGWRC